MVSDVPPLFRRTSSAAKNTMLSVMAALRGGPGTLTTPKVASARERLWPTVKDVMVFTSSTSPRDRISKPITKRRWSIPSRICSTPIRKYAPATSQPLESEAMTKEGFSGLRGSIAT